MGFAHKFRGIKVKTHQVTKPHVQSYELLVGPKFLIHEFNTGESLPENFVNSFSAKAM